MKKTFIKPFPSAHNVILELQDRNHYASFNPSIGASEDPFASFMLGLADIVAGESSIGQEETALKYDGKWYNLRGDHREALEQAYEAGEIAGVLRYFESKSAEWTAHSTGTVETIQEGIAAL